MGSPPRNPAEGQRWKDGRTVYVWQGGKGWVGDRLYVPPAREPIEIGPPAPEPTVGPAVVALTLALSVYAARLRAELSAVAAKARAREAEWRGITEAADRVRAVAPVAKPAPAPRAKPKPKPHVAQTGFSPEFLAQLERVRNGAAIVEVRPVRSVPADMPGTGSSLADIL